MSTDRLATLRTNFPYLYQQGFTFLSNKEDQGLSSFEFGSTEFKLRLDIFDWIIDIFVAIHYPEMGKHGHWYGLAIYIEYLEGHPAEIPGKVAFPYKELEILSGILEQYPDRLRNLSRVGNYQESEKKLSEIAVRVSERNRKRSKERRFDNTRNEINSETGKIKHGT
jgi:hypothetical protein